MVTHIALQPNVNVQHCSTLGAKVAAETMQEVRETEILVFQGQFMKENVKRLPLVEHQVAHKSLQLQYKADNGFSYCSNM